MPDAGDGAEAQDHLLIDVENRDEQRQRPQQRRAVVLTGLPVGGKSARVIVAHHNDQAGAKDGEQRRQPVLPGFARSDVSVKDGAECALNVADVGVIQDGSADVLGINANGHDVPPC